MLDKIISLQKEFQRLAEVKIDTLVSNEINALSEMYLFKSIEEIVELRKTFPSELNKWSKNQPIEIDKQEVLAELSDVLLFIINFCIVRKITPVQVIETLSKVQEVNFRKLKSKKLTILFDEMNRLPSASPLLGSGGLMPKVILIGQTYRENGLDTVHYAWDSPSLNPTIDFLQEAIRHGVNRFSINLEDFYYTDVIKEPVREQHRGEILAKYWVPFLVREIEIISSGCTPLIFALGNTVGQILKSENVPFDFQVLSNPAQYYDTGKQPVQYYRDVLLTALKKFDLDRELPF